MNSIPTGEDKSDQDDQTDPTLDNNIRESADEPIKNQVSNLSFYLEYSGYSTFHVRKAR